MAQGRAVLVGLDPSLVCFWAHCGPVLNSAQGPRSAIRRHRIATELEIVLPHPRNNLKRPDSLIAGMIETRIQ